MNVKYVSEELQALLVKHRSAIKATYHNERLFVDSAIRSKLRRMGLDAGEDELVAHQKKLDSSKRAQAAKRKILRQRREERKRKEEVRAQVQAAIDKDKA